MYTLHCFTFAENRCDSLPHIENAIVDGVNASLLSNLTYICQDGHVYPDSLKTQTVACIKNNDGTYLWEIYHSGCQGNSNDNTFQYNYLLFMYLSFQI